MVHRRGRTKCLPPTQETRTVGFVRARGLVSRRDDRQMRQIDRCFAGRTRPAAEEQRVHFLHVLAFDEHFVKGGMACIGGLRCQDDFGIAGQFDLSDAVRVIRQRHAARFDILVGRNGDRTLVVSVDVIQRSLAVRIEGYRVEPV